MKLRDVLKGIEYASIIGPQDVEITGISINSKKIIESAFTLLTDIDDPGTFECINSNGFTILVIYSIDALSVPL